MLLTFEVTGMSADSFPNQKHKFVWTEGEVLCESIRGTSGCLVTEARRRNVLLIQVELDDISHPNPARS